ncbi:hypothetical protein, partial [Pasteurella multocida]|uniref:hypothetical protein n=1 Tax=Pasteurella multocida TaxID=747 RepID=UPI0035E3F5C4
IYKLAQAQANLRAAAYHIEHFVAGVHMLVTYIHLGRVEAITVEQRERRTAVGRHQLVKVFTAGLEHFSL